VTQSNEIAMSLAPGATIEARGRSAAWTSARMLR
jgi:hypothetical protein